MKKNIKNYKKSRNTRKNTKKNKKTRKNKQKGGLLGFINSGYKTYKPGAYNSSYTTTVTKGVMNRIVYNIEYLVPNNFLLYKDPNSTLTPTYSVTRNGNPNQNCSIMIDKKFVEYFVNVNGDWYALMRIYGLGFNTGYFATWTNTVFYKLKNELFNLNVNEIILTDSDVTIIKYDDLQITQKIVQDKNAEILKIKETLYEANTTGDIYYVLRQFRNEQLANYRIKEEVTDDIAEHVGKKVFSI